MFGNCNERTVRFTAAIGTLPRVRWASTRRPDLGLGCTGRAPWPSHLFIYLFPNLPARSLTRLFRTQPRAGQLGSVRRAFASCGICTAQVPWPLLRGGSWASRIPEPASLVGGACSRAVLAAFLHHSVTGSRGPGVPGFKEAAGQMLGGCLSWGGGSAVGAERTAPTCPAVPERRPRVQSPLQPTPPQPVDCFPGEAHGGTATRWQLQRMHVRLHQASLPARSPLQPVVPRAAARASNAAPPAAYGAGRRGQASQTPLLGPPARAGRKAAELCPVSHSLEK